MYCLLERCESARDAGHSCSFVVTQPMMSAMERIRKVHEHVSTSNPSPAPAAAASTASADVVIRGALLVDGTGQNKAAVGDVAFGTFTSNPRVACHS